MLSKSTIMTSRKLTVISRTPCLNCDSRISATISASVSAAAAIGRRSSTSSTKLSRPQVRTKASRGHQTDLGPQQDAERRKMKRGEAAPTPNDERPPEPAAGNERVRKASAGGMFTVPRPGLRLRNRRRTGVIILQ